jgi:hypothetical protein
MARKIASNLYFLREHPDVAPGLRRVLLAQALPAAPASDLDLARTEMNGAANALH